ncbi:hypothetical protein Mal64_10800 [Pseudobythopirellula maris]|uniref:Uncharacterized protein n=1 Tax=Pseudobythopirellula maris TaxID=2527991 RepID=A0A5C5ZUA6_9BACT|nr:hypothetical protein [Pseudobythopirellula maris]TWT90685.1 hypothetical protein Mal64_10800 [Pseudobythopirellula maris]
MKHGGIKNLLLAHVEKALILVIALVAGWLAYSSLGVPYEERNPSDLGGQAEQTRTSINNFSWPDALQDRENVRIFEGIDAKDAAEPIDDEKYRSGGLNRPVVPPTVDREDPPLLAARKLEGTAITGLMAFADEATRQRRELEELRRQQRREAERAEERNRDNEQDLFDAGRGEGDREDPNRRPAPRLRGQNQGVPVEGFEKIETVSCAVVLAQAPSLDQYQAYKETLENARGYKEADDVPSYAGYEVERAEYRAGALSKWQRVPVTGGWGSVRQPYVTPRTIEEATSSWIEGQEPLVDGNYEDFALTFPLPPLVGRAWGAEVVHSEIPLASETEMLETVDEPEEPTENENGGIFSRPSERGARGGIDRPLERGGPRMSQRGGGLGEFNGGGERGGRSTRRSRTSSEGFSTSIPNLMVRFFDFTVEPGKQYRYRIRLILNDVNQGVSKKYLSPQVLQRLAGQKPGAHQVVFTEYSEPSPVISVPMAGDAYVVSAKLPSSKQVNAEPSVNMLVQSFSIDEEGKAFKAELEAEFNRGDVMNMTEDAEVLTSDGRFIVKKDSFPFRTGSTLIDVDGGEEIVRNVIDAPVRVLLMDPAGRLYLRDEMTDSQEVENHRAIFDGEEQDGGRDFESMGRDMREF